MMRLTLFLCLLVFPQIGKATITKSGVENMPSVKLDPGVTIAIESFLDRQGRNSKLYSMSYVCQKRGRKTQCTMVDLQSNEEVTILRKASNK